MKLLLINPFVPKDVVYGMHGEQIGACLPPLGILYLKSYLHRTRPYHVEILDANALRMDAAKVLEHCLKGQYDCIGFHATTLGYPYAADAALLIRAKLPQMKLILGGPHSQGDAEGVLREYPLLFDYVCYSEGEFAIECLLDYFAGNLPEAELKGWVYGKSGKLIRTAAPPVPEDLDLFGHPAEHIPAEWIRFYHEKVLAYRELPFFAIMSSRGCPFQCAFCSTPYRFKQLYHGKMRYHSIEWLIEEMRILEDRYGVREVNIVDDTFNVNRQRALAFSRKKIESGLRMSWACNFEANIADPELIRAMKDAGCWTIMVGGESGSDRILDFIRKGVTVKKLEQVVQWAHEIGIVTRVSFILGLPTETRESIEETVSLIKRSNIHFPYFQLYVPLPGTALYDQLERYGKILVKDARLRSASKVNYLPEGLTEEELLQAFRRMFRVSYFRWRMIRNHFRFIRSWADLKRYWKGFWSLLRFT